MRSRWGVKAAYPKLAGQPTYFLRARFGVRRDLHRRSARRRPERVALPRLQARQRQLSPLRAVRPERLAVPGQLIDLAVGRAEQDAQRDEGADRHMARRDAAAAAREARVEMRGRLVAGAAGLL